MNLQVFTHRNFAMCSIVAFTYSTALRPSGILLAVTINIVGRLADRCPASRLVMLGLAMLALSFGLIFTVHPAQGLAWLWDGVILGRVELGFILPSLNLGVMRGVPHALIPWGSSVINFIRMVGGTGVSLCAIVREWRPAAAHPKES